MKILTLIENSAVCDTLNAEHGLSLYIETNGRKILFDTGASEAFADNAQMLGIDLSTVDLAVLSHGHYDHSGGLMRFLELNSTAPIYMSRHAFTPCYHGTDRYIGIDPMLRDCGRIQFTDDICTIADGLTLFSCNKRELLHPIDSAGLTVLKDGSYRDDKFLHEQYLLIEEAGKNVLISGCSHKGILNIAHWFRPDVLIGGFHFMNLDPNTHDAVRLRAAAEELLRYPTVYHTGHCTGTAPFQYMKQIMKDKLHAISGGAYIEI